jgi:transposase-like protein
MPQQRFVLHCPHCGEGSSRSDSFVAARRHFVCNHCHEIVRIEANTVGASVARERLLHDDERRGRSGYLH